MNLIKNILFSLIIVVISAVIIYFISGEVNFTILGGTLIGIIISNIWRNSKK